MWGVRHQPRDGLRQRKKKEAHQGETKQKGEVQEAGEMNKEEDEEGKGFFPISLSSFLGALNCDFSSSCILACHSSKNTYTAFSNPSLRPSVPPSVPPSLSPSFLQNPGHGIVLH